MQRIGFIGLGVMGQHMLARGFTPGFRARPHRKDLGIVSDEAGRLNLTLPVSALAEQQMKALPGLGGGERDSSAVARVIEHFSGLTP